MTAIKTTKWWAIPWITVAACLTSMHLQQVIGEEVTEAVHAIEVLQGQSELIKPPWPVKRASVTNPEVADIEIVTPDRILVLGRKIGATDIYLWSESEDVWHARLDVNVDLTRIRSELGQLFPHSELEVAQSQDVVIVTGTLGSASHVEQLAKFLEASKKATGLEYVDMTTLGTRGAAREPTGVPDGMVAGADDDEGPYVDPVQMRRELAELFPGSELDVRQSRDVVIVSGLLRRSEQASQLERYLKALEEASSVWAKSRRESGDPGLKDRQALRFVDMTSLAGVQQVLLRVKVAEATREAIRMLGINVLYTGHNDYPFGASRVGPSSGTAATNINIGPPEGSVAGAGNTPFIFTADVTTSSLTTMILGFPRQDLMFFLQALAENQYLRLLAEPNLVALSGEEASFLAGGEFPIPIVQGSTAGGGSSITIEYKEFGVRLKFRPTVLGDNLIRLHVAPEVSDLSDQGAVEIEGFRIPAIVTRRAETTLEMRSGQTFMMAGLLNERTRALNSRVPGLGDIPVLGPMFRSIRYEKGETELVVLVNAWLVEPMSEGKDLPVPGLLHVAPNDWELYAMGQIEGNQPPKLSPIEAQWLQDSGLVDLKGAGAWASYEQPEEPSQAEIQLAGQEFGPPPQ